MKNVFYMIIITAIVIFACLNASLITSGCSQGIYLWYSSIVPVLLPFMLLTSVILNSADLNHMSACCACMLTLIIGLFCGFPTGTITISFLYKNDRIGRHTAQTMLPICNNVSPMFLYGYLYSSYLYKYISINTLLACLYIPQFICTALFFLIPRIIHFIYAHPRSQVILRQLNINIETAATAHVESKSHANFKTNIISETSDSSDDRQRHLLDNAIHNITLIGIYMVIFAILGSIITNYFPCPSAHIATAFLEISAGIKTLDESTLSFKIKTALFLSLTAFGGLSALFQSYDLIQKSGLSFTKYIFAKCMYGILCGITVFLIL